MADHAPALGLDLVVADQLVNQRLLSEARRFQLKTGGLRMHAQQHALFFEARKDACVVRIMIIPDGAMAGSSLTPDNPHAVSPGPKNWVWSLPLGGCLVVSNLLDFLA